MIKKFSKLQVNSGWNLLFTVLTLGDVESSTEEHRVLGLAATFLGPILSEASRNHSASQFPHLLFLPFSIPLISCSMFSYPIYFLFQRIKQLCKLICNNTWKYTAFHRTVDCFKSREVGIQCTKITA